MLDYLIFRSLNRKIFDSPLNVCQPDFSLPTNTKEKKCKYEYQFLFTIVKYVENNSSSWLISLVAISGMILTLRSSEFPL